MHLRTLPARRSESICMLQSSGSSVAPLAVQPPPLAAEVRKQSPSNSVRGYIFAAGRPSRRTTRFDLGDGEGEHDFAGVNIPDVRIGKVFRGVRKTYITKAFVTLHDRTFLVFGYDLVKYPVNTRITTLKPTTTWRGDVAVLCLGMYKGLLKEPRYSQDIIDEVVTIFVSRVTECIDLGRPVPLYIESE